MHWVESTGDMSWVMVHILWADKITVKGNTRVQMYVWSTYPFDSQLSRRRSDRRGVLLASPPSLPLLQSLVSSPALPPSGPSPPCSLRHATSPASTMISQTAPPGPGQGDEWMNLFFNRHANHPMPVHLWCGWPSPWAGGVSPSGPAWFKASVFVEAMGSQQNKLARRRCLDVGGADWASCWSGLGTHTMFTGPLPGLDCEVREMFLCGPVTGSSITHISVMSMEVFTHPIPITRHPPSTLTKIRT